MTPKSESARNVCAAAEADAAAAMEEVVPTAASSASLIGAAAGGEGVVNRKVGLGKVVEDVEG